MTLNPTYFRNKYIYQKIAGLQAHSHNTLQVQLNIGPRTWILGFKVAQNSTSFWAMFKAEKRGLIEKAIGQHSSPNVSIHRHTLPKCK